MPLTKFIGCNNDCESHGKNNFADFEKKMMFKKCNLFKPAYKIQ